MWASSLMLQVLELEVTISSTKLQFKEEVQTSLSLKQEKSESSTDRSLELGKQLEDIGDSWPLQRTKNVAPEKATNPESNGEEPLSKSPKPSSSGRPASPGHHSSR